MFFFELKYKAVRPSAARTLKWLHAAEGIDDEDYVRLHQTRYLNIVKHAFRNCEFYRYSFREAGFSLSDLSVFENLKHLPVLSRQNVRDNFDGLIAETHKNRNLTLASTGGTTGAPLSIATDPDHALEVISWRRLRAWGAGPSKNCGYIYRAIPSKFGAALRGVFYYPTKREYLSASDLREEKLKRLCDQLAQIKAEYIVGYVGALEVLADYMAANSISLPNLKFVWSTAAPLPRHLKNRLERLFAAPVYSQYGSCEFYWIAAERLDRQGMDVDWDIRSVEIEPLDEQSSEASGTGKLLITDFLNHAFPLIRYDIGDTGRFLESDTSKLPRLDFVHGRTSQTLSLIDGQKIPGEFWTTIFDPYAEKIDGFYVHQLDNYEIHVKFDPNTGWRESDEAELTGKLKLICGETPVILIKEKVNYFDKGKINFVSSDVNL